MDKINIIKATPNFPFLEATIDGLSYYQLLAGLNAYINTVVDLINTTGIEDWKATVDKISAQVSVLATSVSGNSDSINKITSQIGTDELKTDEKTLIGAVNELFATIASVETAIGNENLTTTADTLIGAINELVSDIAGLDESSDEFKTDIANLKNSVTQNTNDISQLKTNVQTNTDDIATAKTDITKLKTDYTLLDGRVTAVEEVEENNNNDITALKTKVGTSTLATTSQNLSDAVNELKSAIGTGGEGEKTPVTSETTITVSGTTAVDAVQLNPNGVDGNGNDGLGNKTFAKRLEENSGVIENYDSRLTVVETTTAGLTTDINSAKSNISSLQEDSEMFTTDITTITANIGKLTELTTTVKNTLVDAINEVNAKPSGGGETTPISNDTNITTTGMYALDAVQNNANVANSLRNLIAGLQRLYNTLSGNVTDLTSKVSTNTSNISSLTNSTGTLTELTTTAKNTLVEAINEVNAKPSPISNESNITDTGTYALDAVQNNADVANTLRNLIVGLESLYNTLSSNVTDLTSKVSTNTSNISSLTNSIGSLSELTTTAKNTLVEAVNEVNASFFNGTSQGGMCTQNLSGMYVDTLFNSSIWNRDITLNQPAILIVDIYNNTHTGGSYYDFAYKANGHYYPYVNNPTELKSISYTDIPININENRHDIFYIPKNVTFKFWSNDFNDKDDVADGSYFYRMSAQLLYLNTDGLG